VSLGIVAGIVEALVAAVAAAAIIPLCRSNSIICLKRNSCDIPAAAVDVASISFG